MADEVASPDEATLRHHLESASFLAGVDEGRWKLLKLEFPDVYVRIVGSDCGSASTLSHDFHFKCDNYPEIEPFVERWDHALGGRPQQPTRGAPSFVDAMKDWGPDNNTHGGIYRAWQRYAAVHNDWETKRPDQAWHRERTIVFILEELYALVSEQAHWLAEHP